MRRDKINSLLRSYVRSHLSPTEFDMKFVSNIYQSFNELSGTNNCVQIGSYPRFTAIKPLHDLDILYIMGDWHSHEILPYEDLNILANRFRREYKNPTSFDITISVQTHSISFKYINGNEEIFAVDLVPALKSGKNEFDENTFYVPEIIKKHVGKRREEFYQYKQRNHSGMIWIKTDPLGYISVASLINSKNADFRKCVKFVKGWKHSCKEINEDFCLKSFHLEQLVTIDFNKNIYQDIFQGVFNFFTALKKNIETPQIPDRADPEKFIDEYISELKDEDRNIINQGIDAILIALENIDGNPNIYNIVRSGFYKRKSQLEAYLFDQKIPVLIDETLKLSIDGYVEKFDGWRKFHAPLKIANGIVDTKNSIEFRVVENNTGSDILKWKVKNDDKCVESRGEINDHHTTQKPEKTAYIGNHFTECYAIKNNICIARDRVNVIVAR